MGPVIGVCTGTRLKTMSFKTSPSPLHISLLDEIVIVTPFSSITQMSTLGQAPPGIRGYLALAMKTSHRYWPNAKYSLLLACNISNGYNIAKEG